MVALVGLTSANSYRSGEVKTLETFTYGRFTTRMQGSDKQGTVGSFFTYWTGPGWTQEGWNEIDVELVPSVKENPFSLNVIWEWQQQVQNYNADFQPGSDWNEYVVEWAPTYVQWELNGALVRRDENTDDVLFLTKNCHLMMNFWTPTWSPWGDNLDDSDMPWYTRYDYVKVEKYNVETESFDFYWQDDFDSFDSKRWLKSELWTFGGNSSTFYVNQVYTEDGALVLKMEKPNSVEDVKDVDEENT